MKAVTLILTAMFCFMLISINAQAMDGLVLYCTFDGTTTCEDGETPSIEIGPSYDDGILGQGIVINDSDRLEYPTLDNFYKDEGTISVWVKPEESFTDTRYVIDIHESSRWRIVSNSTHLAFELYDGEHNVGKTFIFEEIAWEPRWYFLVFTWDLDDGFWAYVDGEPVGFYTDEFYPLDIDSVSSHIEVGYYRDTVAHQYGGTIDELKIHDRKLTDSEILDEYQSVIEPPEPPCNCSGLEKRIESLEESVSGLEDDVSELQDRVSENEDRISELENRADATEATLAALQSSLALLDESFISFRELILGYFTGFSVWIKKPMLCEYMEGNDLDEYSALGMSCRIIEFGTGPWMRETCVCRVS